MKDGTFASYFDNSQFCLTAKRTNPQMSQHKDDPNKDGATEESVNNDCSPGVTLPSDLESSSDEEEAFF